MASRRCAGQSRGGPLWAAIWDQRGLQILVAAFDSSAACRGYGQVVLQLALNTSTARQRAVRFRCPLRGVIARGRALRLEPVGTGNGEAFDTSAPLEQGSAPAAGIQDHRRLVARQNSSMARSTSGRSPLFQSGQAGSTPARVTACRVRLDRLRTLPSQGGNAGSNPARDANAPSKWTAASATNAGSGVRILLGVPRQRRRRAARFHKPGEIGSTPIAATTRAPGRPERRRLDTAKRAGSTPAARTGTRRGGRPSGGRTFCGTRSSTSAGTTGSDAGLVATAVSNTACTR
jgi:hypothetical protein